MFRLVLPITFTLFLLACGPDTGPHRPAPSHIDPTGSPGDGAHSSSYPDAGAVEETRDPVPGVPPSSELAKRNWDRIEVAKTLARDIGGYAIEFAAYAARETNSDAFVTSGSVYEPSDPNGRWTYSPTPTNQLNVHYADGTDYVIKFDILSPTRSMSSTSFFTSSHELSVSVSGPPEGYRVYSKDKGRDFVRSIAGRRMECTYDLTSNGSRLTDVYSGGSTVARDDRIKGSIKCGEEAATVNWGMANSLDNDGSGTVFDQAESFNYTWRGAAGAYELRNGQLLFTRDSIGPSRFEAKGTIFKDGKAVGEHATRVELIGQVRKTTQYVSVDDGYFDVRTEQVYH